MSSVVVISGEDLRKLIREELTSALADGFSGIRPAGEWTPANRCPLPRATLDRLRKEGLVRSAKVGREVRVHAGDVDAWLASCGEASRPSQPSAPEEDEPSDPFERARARARTRRAA